jgi:phage terminase large subunit
VSALHEFVIAYGPEKGEYGPVLFAQEVFGVTLDPWQESLLRAYGRGERRLSVRACHGPGKTFIASIMVWHSLLCRYPQHTVVTAPSKGQLEGALVKEVRQRYAQLPPALQTLFEVKALRIELKAAPDFSWFEARTARAENPEALQGVHCDGGYVLLIADEASGVHEHIFVAAAGSMSGHNATTLLLSNPVRTSGFFFDTHNKLKDMWYTVRVSHEDSKRVSDDFVYDISRRYGETSNAFRVRCLGEFPLADQDTIIPYEFIASARQRDLIIPPNLPEIWALDVARFGDDQNVFLKRNTLCVLPDIRHWGGVDLMQTTGKVKAAWDETPSGRRPEDILVDVIGLGAGVVDRLRELNLPVRGINVGESSAFSETYRNLRTELWFKGKEWLSTKDHVLPKCEGGCSNTCPHELLAQELSVLRYQYTSNGKFMAESKADLKKRGHKSPDFADAFMLTFAGDPATITHGSAGGNGWGGNNWNEPISRGLYHV